MSSLNKEQIKELLPHREPMLLIDELRNIKKLFFLTFTMAVAENNFLIFNNSSIRSIGSLCGKSSFICSLFKLVI